MTRWAVRRMHHSVLGAAGLFCMLVPAVSAESPRVADLIGMWECNPEWCGGSSLRFDNDAEDPKKLIVLGANDDLWDMDELANPAKGFVSLKRKPTAAQMGEASAPEWARKEVEGKLEWRLKLQAEKGKPTWKDYLTSPKQIAAGDVKGDPCAMTLKGFFYPGKIKENSPEPGKAEVATGPLADEGKILLDFAKKWYDLPKLDERITFAWRNPHLAQGQLGVVADEKFINDLRDATLLKGAYTAYRQLAAYIFKAGTYALPMVGVGGVVSGGAESFLGQLAQNAVENIVGKAIEGDELGREIFVEAVAATLASVFMGELVSIDPGHLEELSKSLAEELGERWTGPVAQQLKTKEQINERLEKEFLDQCRFELQAVKFPGNIGGLMIVDKGKHEVELVLYVPSNTEHRSGTVRGRFSYLDGSGVQPASTRVNLDLL